MARRFRQGYLGNAASEVFRASREARSSAKRLPFQRRIFRTSACGLRRHARTATKVPPTRSQRSTADTRTRSNSARQLANMTGNQQLKTLLLFERGRISDLQRKGQTQAGVEAMAAKTLLSRE